MVEWVVRNRVITEVCLMMGVVKRLEVGNTATTAVIILVIVTVEGIRGEMQASVVNNKEDNRTSIIGRGIWPIRARKLMLTLKTSRATTLTERRRPT